MLPEKHTLGFCCSPRIVIPVSRARRQSVRGNCSKRQSTGKKRTLNCTCCYPGLCTRARTQPIPGNWQCLKKYVVQRQETHLRFLLQSRSKKRTLNSTYCYPGLCTRARTQPILEPRISLGIQTPVLPAVASTGECAFHTHCCRCSTVRVLTHSGAGPGLWSRGQDSNHPTPTPFGCDGQDRRGARTLVKGPGPEHKEGRHTQGSRYR